MANNSLEFYMNSKQNNVNELFSLMTMIRIFQGIEYLHLNSLIYRDLKPSNILLDHDFIPYISDFPTIRHPIASDDDAKYTTDLGSFIYASPEQLRNDHYSYPTDIFSFGVIIYFLYEKKFSFIF